MVIDNDFYTNSNKNVCQTTAGTDWEEEFNLISKELSTAITAVRVEASIKTANPEPFGRVLPKEYPLSEKKELNYNDIIKEFIITTV